MTFDSPKSALATGFGAIGLAVLAVLAVAALIALNWALASVIVFLGLNAIGGFGLSFAQVIGIGLLLSAVTPTVSK